jgi:hypothetical protein
VGDTTEEGVYVSALSCKNAKKTLRESFRHHLALLNPSHSRTSGFVALNPLHHSTLGLLKK